MIRSFFIDDDNRWTLVPDDLVSTRRGVPPNSLRTFGDDAEYEDKINFMRRDAWNEGCKGSRVLGVTYNTQYTRNNPGLPANYHSPRQTITVGVRWKQMKADMCILLLS